MNINLAQYIDHTVLKANASQEEIEKLCQEAIDNNFYAVCLHHSYISLATELLKESQVKIASVMDFPFGSETVTTRVSILKELLKQHSNLDEVDIVAPLHLIQNNNWRQFKEDVQAIKQAVQESNSKAILKTIIEVSLFTKEQVQMASRLLAEAGHEYVKTSTGIINTRPTELQDIINIREAISEFPEVKIKASAGVKTKEQALQFIKEGVSRIGTSSGMKIIA